MKQTTVFASVAAVLVVAACSEPTASPAVSAAAKSANLIVVGGGFGPVDCVRGTGKPQSVTFNFSGADGQAAVLHLTDNGVQGLNGTIELNGEVVVTHPMLGGTDPLDLSVPVTLAAANTLVCKLEGKPGSGLTMSVQ